MHELTGLLCGLISLVVVLGIITVCGHGMWIVLAAMFKALSGNSSYGNSPGGKPTPCPHCGRLGLVNGRCLSCGNVPGVSLAERTRQDLQATARQLHRLHVSGHLSYEQCLTLLKVLEADLARFGSSLPLEAWPNPQSASAAVSPFASPVATAPPVSEQPAVDTNKAPQPVVLDAFVIDETTTPPVAAEPVRAQTDLEQPVRAETDDFVHQAAPVAARHALTPAPPPAASPFSAPAAELKPRTPSRTLADMLQGFMEESNIRWIEVIGGMLIVVCAIGLVWSLRATLQYIPYFPALVFLVFTVMFHGAGLYTLWYWKLTAISRAILIIALLLVPLSFAAGVALERSEVPRPLTDPLLLTAIVVGLGVFGAVSYTGSKELAGEGALRLTTAILGSCVGQVIVNRAAGDWTSRTSLSLIGLLPVAAFLIATLGQIWRAQAWQRMSSRRIEQTFLILGVSLFALLPPLTLLLYKVPPRWGTFKELTPLLSLVATAVLTLGLVVHRRALEKTLAPLRTAGTAIAIVGGALLIFLWVMAWPRPDLMLSVTVLTGGLLLAVALRTKMPALHVAATSSLMLGALVAFFWSLQLVSSIAPTGLQWVQAALLGRTSLLLSSFAVVLGAVGGWRLFRQDQRLGIAYLVMAGVVSFLSLAIAGWSGFVPLAAPWTGDGDLTGPLFFCYAVALFGIAFKIKNENVVTAAMALLWVALIQLFSENETARSILSNMHLLPERPVLVATILEGVILAVMALVLAKPSWLLNVHDFTHWQRSETYRNLIVPLTYGAAGAIVTSLPFILWVLPGRFSVHAAYAALAAAVWATACVARRWHVALAVMQGLAAITVAFAIAAIWTPPTSDPWWFARGGHLQAQLLALAATAAVWSLVRRFTPAGSVLHDLLHPSFPACDHVLLGWGVALLVALSISTAWPGFAWELGFGASELSIADIPWLEQNQLTRLTWGLCGVVLALLVALADRITGLKLVGLSLAGWAGCFLLAQAWNSEHAVASAVRWSIGLYGGSLMAVFAARNWLHRGLQTQSWLRWQRFDEPVIEWFRYQPLLLGVLPMLALTITAVAQNASGASLRGPDMASIFGLMRPTANYAGPLVVGVMVFLGLALAQRQPAFAFGGGLLFQLAANLAFILHVTGKTNAPPGMIPAELLQWNTIAAAVYALLWFALSYWLVPRRGKEHELLARIHQEKFFLAHVSLSAWLILIAAIWAVGAIIRFPDGLAAESIFLGHWSNVIAVGLIAAPLLAALGVTRAARTWPVAGSGIMILLSTALPLVAIRYEFFRGRGSWAAYHVLEIGWLILAAVVAASYGWLAWKARGEQTVSGRTRRGFVPQHLLSAALCTLVVVLAMRGNYYDPAEPYLSTACTAGVCLVLIALGVARRSQPYAFASLLIAPLAVALPWFAPSITWWDALGSSTFLVGLNSCLLAVIVVGGFWQFLEIRTQQRTSQTFSPRWFGPLPGHFAIWSVTFILACASLLHLPLVAWPWYVTRLPAYDPGLIALVVVWFALGIVNLGSLWDRRATFIFPALLVWMWVAGALVLSPLREQPLPTFCLHALFTAAVFALAGHLWSYGANLAVWGEKLGISDTIGGLTRIGRWLPGLTMIAGIAICGLELIGMWNLPLREHRVAVAFAPALIAYAIACLAQKERTAAFQLAALLFGGVSCVYLGWSNLDPAWELSDWMTRAFRLLMVLGLTTLAYGLILPRFVFHAQEWLRASQRAGYVSSVLAISALVALLAMEVALFQPGIGVAEVDSLQVGAVAVLLVLFIVGLISLALAPGGNTPGEQFRRTWFVYGAQAVAGLLFAHLYLCQPGWFDGVLRPYWPYVVLAIAFSGVGLGELFWRLRLPVLAEPFQRTGAFLPVLPILGLWIVNSHSKYDYTLLLVFAGLMYLILSIVRKSWAAAVAAVIAGNGALWALLEQQQWSPWENPQFWLIPPAISVLIAAQINRHRLKDEVLSAIRYASLIVIYVSSTAEIFLHEAGHHLWPPVLLAILSLFGVLLGVLLRIRAFLYLGSVFTLLALISMVWHAARAIDHVWPWWAFGFGMGIALLGLMAFFEKNRPQVQALVTRLRQWDQ